MRVSNSWRCLGPNVYPEAPDGDWGWMVALAFFWVEVCTYGTLKTLETPGIFRVRMDEPWELNSRVPRVISICYFVFHFTAPLSTVLSNRFGHRPVVMTGGFLISLGTISSAFTSSINETYITFGLISGLGYCFTFFPTITILAQYFSRRRALVTSLASFGECLAVFAFGPALIALKEYISWCYCLVVLGIIQASVIGCGLLLRPITIVSEPVKEDEGSQKDSLCLRQMQTVYKLEKEQTRTSISSGVSGGSEDSGVTSLSASKIDLRTAGAEAKALMEEQDKEGQGSPPTSEQDQGDPVETEAGPLQPSSPKLLDFSVLKDGAFICYSLSGLFATFGFFAPQLYILKLSKVEGMAALYAVFMLIVTAGAEIVGRLSIGVVLNQVCCRKTLVILVCVVLLCPVMGAFTNLPDIEGALVCLGLYGLLKGAVTSTHIPLLAEEEVVGIEKMSSCVGLYVFIQSFAGLAGPPLGGVLVDVSHYYSATAEATAVKIMFFSSAVAMGLSAICLALVSLVKSGLCQRQGRSKEKGNSAEERKKISEDDDQPEFLKVDLVLERSPARRTKDQDQTCVI